MNYISYSGCNQSLLGNTFQWKIVPYWNRSIDLQSNQLTGFYMKWLCTESYFRTDYRTVFPKICLFLKNKVILIPWKYFPVWLKYYVNFNTSFYCLLLLTDFLILAFNVGFMQLEFLSTLSVSPYYLRLGFKISYFQ